MHNPADTRRVLHRNQENMEFIHCPKSVTDFIPAVVNSYILNSEPEKLPQYHTRKPMPHVSFRNALEK
jgi:hypothetical protein